MPKPNRLGELEREFGERPETLIPRTVNDLGSQKLAANKLGMAESTISLWLRQNGYVPIVKWVKLPRKETDGAA